MIPAQTVSWTEAQALARLRTYRGLLILCLGIDVLLGLFAVAAPHAFARWLGQAEAIPSLWPRVWGAALVGMGAMWASGWRDPVFCRWPNWCGIAFRLVAAILFFCGGRTFLAPALWDAVTGLLLLITYYRLTAADLACRP